jgi:hypothetical protein
MERKNALALMAVGLLFAGLASAARPADAHNFSHNETTNFLAEIELTKTDLQLAKSNLGDPQAAQAFSQSAAGRLNGEWIKEISEKNERVAGDLEESLGEFPPLVKNGSPEQVRQEVSRIKNLLGEAVSARIEKDQLGNSTTRALVASKVLSEALKDYQMAFGVAEEEAYMVAYGIAMEMSEGEGTMSQRENGTDAEGDEVVDRALYERSRALASKAFFLATKIKRADAADPNLVDAAKAAIREIKNEISGEQEPNRVVGLMHGKVHENLRKAFGLQVEQGGSHTG